MKFKIRVGTSLSDFYDQEIGVMQGSILSVTFFYSSNSIISCIRNDVDKSLFVGEFGVLYGSKHMQAIERQLQLRNRTEDWSDKTMVLNSPNQRLSVCICRRKGFQPDPHLVLHNNPIPVKKDTMFLGI